MFKNSLMSSSTPFAVCSGALMPAYWVQSEVAIARTSPHQNVIVLVIRKNF